MKMDVTEVKRLSTDKLIDKLTYSFLVYAEKDIINKHPSVFLLGQPGIGKSQAVFKIADNLREKLNKNVNVNDIRLLLFNPVDLRGIPVADMNKRESVWLKPEVFNFEQTKDDINILFLDELTSAPSSLQAVAYQIALDRKIGEHKIPDNTFIIAAGNRMSDNAVTYEMPTALRNRFMHFELEVDFDSWISWANNKCIHPEIINFLKNNPDKISNSDFDNSSNIIITPRSWEFLSNLLNNLGGSIKNHRDLIASIIGVSLTSLLLSDDKVLPIKDILEGKALDKPKSMSELQRLNDILHKQIDVYAKNESYMNNILDYLLNIPMDYAITIFRKIIKINNLDYDITQMDNYQIFLTKLGDYNKNE